MIKRFFFVLSLTCIVNSQYAQDSIKIGFLFQDKLELAAVHGAQLAVKEANQKGGINGQLLHLITKSMEGPWGTGSKQAVSLIWDDKVCALIGSHDGRNAHLVEQASAKSIVPFISAWSSDPTLSQAFIPWFFNCVPNDEQQAEALLHKMFEEKKFKNVVVISDNSYDSNQALKSYRKRSESLGHNKQTYLNFNAFNAPEFLAKIKSTAANCVVLLADPKVSYQVVQMLTSNNLNLPVYAFFFVLNENYLSEKEYLTLKKLIHIPDAGWSEIKLADFTRLYVSHFGRKPGPAAIFAFDATNALINSIRIAKSTENEKIRYAISDLNYEAITGTIRFGNLGMRLNSCLYK